MKILLLIIVLLSGCSEHKPSDIFNNYNITILKTSDARDICSKKIGMRVKACAVWWDNPKSCLIIISHYDFNNTALLGHELMHCTDGSFH